MKLMTEIQEGIRNLYFAKLRTFLALLGITIGTASVVAMVLGGTFATNEALKQFKTLGTNLLAISLISTTTEIDHATAKQSDLSIDNALNLRHISSDIKEIAPYSQLFYPSQFSDKPLNAAILGITSEFNQLVKLQLDQGRFISTLDHYNYYCVIGYNIYQNIKKLSFQNPIGQTIQIGGNLFTIIGVLKPWPENNFVYANIDSTILVPLQTSFSISKYVKINHLLMQISPTASIDQLQEKIQVSISNQIQGVSLNFRSAKELINKMKKQSDILTIFLGLIGGISLLVGGIGVMNIMLISVIERRREIGIRLAIGARQSDIALLFIVEAAILSIFGGTLGVILGLIIAYIITIIWHWTFTFILLPILIGFSVSVLVGLISGVYPAYVAAKLNPIDVIKSE